MNNKKQRTRRLSIPKYVYYMKLTLFLFVVSMTMVFADASAQRINLRVQHMPLQKVLVELSKQSSYTFVYNDDLFGNKKAVNIDLVNSTLEESLEQLLKPLALTYQIKGQSIAIKPRPVVAPKDGESTVQQQPIRGRVTNEKGEPLVGASIYVLDAQGNRTAAQTKTDEQGYFELPQDQNGAKLEVVYLGYTAQKLTTRADMGVISLKPFSAEVEEVLVNTGYQTIPKERATGSFTVVQSDEIQRSVGTDLVSRLEGLVGGMQFNRQNVKNEAAATPELRIRGLSTIESGEDPLIIVDDFPFNGDLNSINPNDVEQVTLLKDAAAASIWGARAGNGVLVITTKGGKYNQKAKFEFVTNLSSLSKPDLYYNQKWLPSATVMEIQKKMYELGYYNEADLQKALPPYVELMRKAKLGLVTVAEFEAQENLFQNTDVRDEALKYLYRNGFNQQYAFSARGGSASTRYHFSTGYDKNTHSIVGNQNDRLNLNLQTTFNLAKSLELGTSIWLTNQNATNNGVPLSSIQTGYAGIQNAPYVHLVGTDGRALDVPKNVSYAYLEDPANANLLDWYYRPVDEVALSDNSSNAKEIRLNGSIRYGFLKHFNLSASYQYLLNFGQDRFHYAKETFYARALINRYTQENGQYAVPNGGILSTAPHATTNSHSGRTLLNYSQIFGVDHEIVALAGLELRHADRLTLPSNILYNYNDEILTASTTLDYVNTFYTRPTGGLFSIPGPPSYITKLVDRDLSYFGNFAYTYQKKYTLSGSARYDGSNLFGVKTNQKGTPLWSLGGSWEISRENFFRMKDLSYLRIRSTFGVSGNVNKTVTHYPTVFFFTHDYTKLPAASLQSPGNPSLRWENVYTYNAGADFAMFDQRLRGSVEYYVKSGSDLIGDDILAPSKGLINYKINYANIRTQGWDVQLDYQLIKPSRQDAFSWNVGALFSAVSNEVTHFNTNTTARVINYLGSYRVPVVGRSRDAVYALPWHGLDPENGLPIIYINGEKSREYDDFYGSTPVEDLVLPGVSVPTIYGSFRNVLSWKRVQLDMMLTWKGNYVFRRASMNPGDEYNVSSAKYHQDYLKRWQKPGDEKYTDVPAEVVTTSNVATSVGDIYANSEVLITKGDHIRFQDVRLSYSLGHSTVSRAFVDRLTVFVYARDLGILWRANDFGIDPDVPAANYPAQRSFSIGLNMGF